MKPRMVVFTPSAFLAKPCVSRCQTSSAEKRSQRRPRGRPLLLPPSSGCSFSSPSCLPHSPLSQPLTGFEDMSGITSKGGQACGEPGGASASACSPEPTRPADGRPAVDGTRQSRGAPPRTSRPAYNQIPLSGQFFNSTV